MTAAATQQPPAIPPRPVKSQGKDESLDAAPKIPPRPASKRIDRSISPNPERFAQSPLSGGIPVKSPKTLRFSHHFSDHETEDPIDRSGSVPMPSVGQEGVEYSAVTREFENEEKKKPVQQQQQQQQPQQEEEREDNNEVADPGQTRTVAQDLKLHAPKPSLPAHSAKQRVQAVTRTDSDKAAAFGIGRPTSREGYTGRSASRDATYGRSTSREGYKKNRASGSFSTSDGRPEFEDEQGIPEIGQRVPMNPHLGDVQAPSPGPGAVEFKKHHHRKHSSRGGPPGSYGLHGHGVAPQDKLEKDYYERHPEVLEREHQTPLHDRQNDYAMSSKDLNKLVRETASRGSGLGTSGEYQSTPTDEVGFQATEEYTSRISSPRPVSSAKDNLRAASFKSEITGPDGNKVIHVDDPKHPEYRSYGDEEAAVDDEEHEHSHPILAPDEISQDQRRQQPAVHPPPERRGSANDMDDPPSRPLSRGARPTSRPNSIYKNNPSQEFAPTPLDDVEEYEPLFPENANKEADKPRSKSDASKARHFFPSKDIWEDAPNSVHYTAEVSTPDVNEQQQTQQQQQPEEHEQRRTSSVADRPKTPAHAFAQQQEELAEREVNGPADVKLNRQQERPVWPDTQKDPVSFLKQQTRPVPSQRFPSRDIWEDAPESHFYEATVSAEPEDIKQEEPKNEEAGLEESKVEEAKPDVPPRPVKKTSGSERPAIPERPKPKQVPSDDGAKTRPPVSDKPKPQIPPRPTKSLSGDSKDGESKTKPPVPSRPVGSKIAALQAGFMSDLNKRLQIGPQAPKKEEPKPQEDLSEEKEKAPLSDARKSRARGPQRRAPARSPAAPAAETAKSAPVLSLSSPQTFWSIDPDEGSLSVAGQTDPVAKEPQENEPTEAEPVAAEKELAQTQPTQAEPVQTESPAPTPENVESLETRPAEAPEREVDVEQPVNAEPTEAAVEPTPEQPVKDAVEPSSKASQTQDKVPEKEPEKEEKTLVANTAGESILETKVEKEDAGQTIEPVNVSDEPKQ